MIVGSTHILKSKARWLGVSITLTLSPGPHLRTIKANINSTINQLNRIIQTTFGLCKKVACMLVKAVVITRTVLGIMIWYTNNNRKAIEKQLNSWLFQAFRLCTGMMKPTPTPFLKLFGGIRSLTKQQIKLTHNYLHSKMTAPIDDVYRTLVWRELTAKPRSHPSPLNNLLGKHTFLQQHSTRAKTLWPFSIPPWSSRISNLININLTKEKEKLEIENQLVSE
ncbi:hypothetical protein O181_057664 [Austropuccinia psidii MF-1]|uniref:Uncharacterized protein n=1 Tax=Austropuccinia psidii MF-1 TaxID=1389203 RepID=A0A9Q3EAV5_9BASI|nr:hypothetical protein [Austropuccinia psidii MF-1]